MVRSIVSVIVIVAVFSKSSKNPSISIQLKAVWVIFGQCQGKPFRSSAQSETRYRVSADRLSRVRPVKGNVDIKVEIDQSNISL